MRSDFFYGRKVLATGGAGFLGSYIVHKIIEEGGDVFVPQRAEYDLRTEEGVVRCLGDYHPEIVIHAAVTGGGIGFNQAYPGACFYDNIMMGTLLMEYSRRADVKKFVGIGTVCAYPKSTPSPFREEDLWSGYPEETNAPYGLAKKMMLVQAKAYWSEYRFLAVNPVFVNMYGPRDNFDLESSHVIAAMIRKFEDAKMANKDVVTVWGDGLATRDFLFVEDAADAVLLAAKRLETPEPVNIGSGTEISVRQLVELIKALVGFRGQIHWDNTKPGGQPRRKVDVSRSLSLMGFHANTPLESGLKETIKWYRRSQASIFRKAF